MAHRSSGRYDGLTPSDMHIYGAEDMDELVSILNALEFAHGDDAYVEGVEPGTHWAPAMRASRYRLGTLSPSSVPTSPGICVIFSDEEPVFVGKGTGRRGLRGRIRAHCATDGDLSRSTLRASVGVDLLGVSRWTARQRPGVLPAWAIESVNAYMSACEVAWVECASPQEAIQLRRNMLAEFRPEYNRE